jgi:hypothetical protein
MAALRMSIPITKADAAQRLVYGVATAEIADRAGEICDYASTKPLYEKWSEAIAASSGGKSLGNLRAMHGAVAAGKVTALTFNDDARQIEICAKVVDDAEWIKVAEGVYTGFSQGGAYARRWTDASGAKRYTADPQEISLVDLPCLPQARFEMVKADGSHEWRAFKQPDGGQDSGHDESQADGDELDKIGARNSAADQARIQKLHDTAVDLGAVCGSHKMQSGELAKYHADIGKHFGDLAKQVEAMTDRLAKTLGDLAARLKTVEDQPLPLPFAMQARAVSKQDDAATEADGGLDALLADPNALSLLAIKLAQRHGGTPRR